jgi:hypothetical protein
MVRFPRFETEHWARASMLPFCREKSRGGLWRECDHMREAEQTVAVGCACSVGANSLPPQSGRTATPRTEQKFKLTHHQISHSPSRRSSSLFLSRRRRARDMTPIPARCCSASATSKSLFICTPEICWPKNVPHVGPLGTGLYFLAVRPEPIRRSKRRRNWIIEKYIEGWVR